MTIPDSCTDSLPAIRWAGSSGVNGRLYMEGSGCGTMTDLYQTRVENDGWTPTGPIYILDENDDIVLAPTAYTGKWLLTAELYVREGAIFYCRGAEIGGDCDELRIQSTGSDDYHEIRGHGGSLYFENTLVTSWDTPNKQPQEEHEGGRSFLNCLSEFESDETCEGQPKNDFGECRMDIINSEMGYLGFFDSESYGLSWKVRGFCADKSNLEVFDTTNVYGDIKNSNIHHMYYGMYSYGHQGGVWTDNTMHNNVQYGFDPHDDSNYLTIARNEVYMNMNHGIIASKRCKYVDIYDNEVYDGGAQAVGIFLHRSSNNAKIYNNNVHDMQDAGVALLESSDAEVYGNTFSNLKFGVRISVGGSNNEIYYNVIDTCSEYGLYTYEGNDEPDTMASGRPSNNVFRNNEITNTAEGLKIQDSDDTQVYDNIFSGTEELTFTDSDGTVYYDNIVSAGTCARIEGSNTFLRSDGLPDEC
ncbi:unnamed protein product [Ascophyllum nodosum]